MMQPQFLLRQHEPVSQDFPIPPEGVRIGRVPDNTIVLDDDTVSRYHAIVWEQDGQVFVRDENSANGTLVGEQVIPASQAHLLQPGDHVRVGLATFSLVMGEAAPPAAVPLAPVPLAAAAGLPIPLLIGGGIVVVLAIVIVVALAMQGSSSSTPLAPLPATLTPASAPASSTPSAPSPEPPTQPAVVAPSPTTVPQQPARPAATPTPQLLSSLLAAMEQAKKTLEELGWDLDEASGTGNLNCENAVRHYEALQLAPSFSVPAEQSDVAGIYNAYRRAVDPVLRESGDVYTACRNALAVGSGGPSTEQRNRARQSISNADPVLHDAIRQAKELVP